MDRLVADLVSGRLPRWPGNGRAHGAAQAKEFFDWNWAVNTQALMAPYLRAAGVHRLDKLPAFQKVCVSLLLFLARTEEGRNRAWTEGTLVQRMARWDPEGSARFGWRAELGSPTSRSAAIEHLLDMGLLERCGKRIVALGEAGEDLSGLLPKDAWDPHQPRRLAEWMETWPASRPAMERYLGTWWSKVRNRRPDAIRAQGGEGAPPPELP